MKTLVIVESPAKSSKIQRYLGNDYIVLASKGHIVDLAKGGKHGLGVDINNDFKPRYVLMEDRVDILDQLIAAAKECDRILVASDPDREGEAIAWHLSTRLEDTGKPIKRMVFNALEKSKILKALSNVRDTDEKLFHSQEARRILDRLVGFMVSPFLMNLFSSNLSAGRVQSVVTRLIVDREREIENFVPEKFWTIQVNVSNDNKTDFITKYAYRITDENSANEIYSDILNCKEFVVSEVVREDEKKNPLPPLVTSTLQQLMSRTHNMGADRTMKAAQSLYENGHCTYIRTDSVRVEDEALNEVRRWLVDNKYPVPKKHYVYKNKDSAQDAHECIRPTDLNSSPDITDPDEKLVYDNIKKYFIASQMMPAVYSTLRITANDKDSPELEIKASGKALKSKGYLDILSSTTTDNSTIDIPNLSKGDKLYLFGEEPVKLEKKQTQPPPRYSEDKLIKELVNRGIGRPSTFADLLSKVTARNYVEKKGNVYHATDLGKEVTDILSQYFTFMDYNFTSAMEKQLDDIESGKINHIDMLKEFFPKFKSEIDNAQISCGGLLCEKCGSLMSKRQSKTTGETFLGCNSYPRCRFTISGR